MTLTSLVIKGCEPVIPNQVYRSNQPNDLLYEGKPVHSYILLERYTESTDRDVWESINSHYQTLKSDRKKFSQNSLTLVELLEGLRLMHGGSLIETMLENLDKKDNENPKLFLNIEYGTIPLSLIQKADRMNDYESYYHLMGKLAKENTEFGTLLSARISIGKNGLYPQKRILRLIREGVSECDNFSTSQEEYDKSELLKITKTIYQTFLNPANILLVKDVTHLSNLNRTVEYIRQMLTHIDLSEPSWEEEDYPFGGTSDGLIVPYSEHITNPKLGLEQPNVTQPTNMEQPSIIQEDTDFDLPLKKRQLH